MSATQLLNFLDSDLQTPQGSQQVAGGLTLNNPVTSTILPQLALSLDNSELADKIIDQWNIDQGESASINVGY